MVEAHLHAQAAEIVHQLAPPARFFNILLHDFRPSILIFASSPQAKQSHARVLKAFEDFRSLSLIPRQFDAMPCRPTTILEYTLN